MTRKNSDTLGGQASAVEALPMTEVTPEQVAAVRARIADDDTDVLEALGFAPYQAWANFSHNTGHRPITREPMW